MHNHPCLHTLHVWHTAYSIAITHAIAQAPSLPPCKPFVLHLLRLRMAESNREYPLSPTSPTHTHHPPTHMNWSRPVHRRHIGLLWQVLPVNYNHKPSAARGGWCDVSSAVLWAFGHGLSYTTFQYSNLELPAGKISATGIVTVGATVANIGSVAGDTVVQLYIRDKLSSVTTPVRMLKGFQRVSLAAGQNTTITFRVDVEGELRILNRSLKWMVEAGEFDVMVGGASDDTPLTGTFTVG